MTTSDPRRSSSDRPASKRLPRDPSLEHLRKQAKSLLKGCDRGLFSAQQRFDAVLPGKPPRLTDAQHVIAIEYGFPSWPKLAAHVASVTGQSTDWHRDENDNLPKAANDGDLDRLKALVAAGDFTQHDLDLALARCNTWGQDDEAGLKMAAFLIAAGADPNGEYGGNYGPILLAHCEGHSLAMIHFLLEHGADAQGDPDRQTKYPTGNTPMRMLLGTYVRGRFEKKREAIDLLMEYGATRPPEVDDLAFAIFRDDADELNRLLDAKPDRIGQRFKGFPFGNIGLEGATYLHQAVEFEAVRCVDALCAREYPFGIEINTPADVIDGLGGQTPLFHAVASNSGGNFPMFEHLIAKYGQWIDFTARATFKSYGEPMRDPVTPLQWAEHCAKEDNGYWKSKDRELAILRARDARSTMEQAVRRGDTDTATGLMDAHPEHVGPHLWGAAIHGAKNLPLVRELLNRGVDPNGQFAPRRALDLACYSCLADIVALLLEHGADAKHMNELGELPIDLVEAYEPRPLGDTDAGRTRALLREAGTPEDIHTLVRAGEVEAVQAMLDGDPTLIRHNVPWSPLHTAARAGRVEVARLLLSRGAEVDQYNDKRNTPLWFACQSPAVADDRVAVAHLLIDAGADPNRRCENDTTPLHFAAWRGPAAMVKLLLERGADPSLQDDRGQTPLDHARWSKASTDSESIITSLTQAM